MLPRYTDRLSQSHYTITSPHDASPDVEVSTNQATSYRRSRSLNGHDFTFVGTFLKDLVHKWQDEK